jgi:hypothetical protein
VFPVLSVSRFRRPASDPTTSQPHSAAVLADVFAHQHILGNLSDRRCKVGHALP